MMKNLQLFKRYFITNSKFLDLIYILVLIREVKYIFKLKSFIKEVMLLFFWVIPSFINGFYGYQLLLYSYLFFKLVILKAFISEIRKIAKESAAYFSFRKIVKDNSEILELLKLAQKAHIKNYNLEFIIKVIIVKISSYPFMYFICKYI